MPDKTDAFGRIIREDDDTIVPRESRYRGSSRSRSPGRRRYRSRSRSRDRSRYRRDTDYRGSSSSGYGRRAYDDHRGRRDDDFRGRRGDDDYYARRDDDRRDRMPPRVINDDSTGVAKTVVKIGDRERGKVGKNNSKKQAKYMEQPLSLEEYTKQNEIDPETSSNDLEQQYATYKAQFADKNQMLFFDAHHKEDWFQEVYMRVPDSGIFQTRANNFLNKPEVGDPARCVRFGGVASFLPRDEVYKLFNQQEGLVRMLMSPARKYTQYRRMGWAYYDTVEHGAQAEKNVHMHKFVLPKKPDWTLYARRLKKAIIKQPKVSAQSLSPAIVTEDSELADRLIAKLDEERKVLERACELVDLDSKIAYLRHVHDYCFYCAKLYENEEDLFHICGEAHVREDQSDEKNKMEDEEEDEQQIDPVAAYRLSDFFTAFREATEANLSMENLSSTAFTYLDYRLQGQALELFEEEWLTRHTTVKRDMKVMADAEPGAEVKEVFACTICAKMFLADKFSKKHLLSKHEDVLARDRERLEYLRRFKALASKDWSKITALGDTNKQALRSRSVVIGFSKSPEREARPSARAEKKNGRSITRYVDVNQVAPPEAIVLDYGF